MPLVTPRNPEVLSSKGCLCNYVIAVDAPLRQLYDSEGFRRMLCTVLLVFNHSSFPITTMIEVREHGGKFEYVRRVRSFETGELNCKGAESVLDSFAHFKF